MPPSKKWSMKKFFKANSSCGCGPNATDIIEPVKRKSKSKGSFSDQPKPIELDDDDDFMSCPDESNDQTKELSKILGSVAVVKNSDNPYRDFRCSMLQMIFEKEIYSRNDLEELLECFLRLNEPRHHEVIVEAFMEIWNYGVSDYTSGDDEEEMITTTTTTTTSCSSSRFT